MTQDNIALLKRYEEAKLLNIKDEQFAQQEGMTYNQLRGRIYRIKLKTRTDSDFRGFDRPELYDWNLPQEWRFGWDDFMVVGDIQLPTTDYDFAMLPAVVAQKHLRRSRKLILAGDIYNMDAWSKYPEIIPVPTWEMEKEAARNLLTIYSQTFDEIYMISGNHERRILEHMGGQYDIQDVLAASIPSGKVKATVLDKCTVDTSKGTYTVVHGDNYSKKPLNNADELAQKFQTHIISHHEHHAAIGMDRFDRYFIVNNGGLFDQKKMGYANLKTNTCANMSHGFTMVKDGYPYLFADWTDWRKWI